MNVLMIGTGKGSWTMRGAQLGAALGARVVSTPTDADWQWATVVVLVKRAGAIWAAAAHAAGVPIVWDALDCWSQPRDNRLTSVNAVAMLQRQQRAIRPMLTIGATQAMATACGGTYLPHHSWKGLTPTPARETVRVIAYEGNAGYLGPWRPALEALGHKHGWRFVVNPPDLREADVIVALRGGAADGWICREWKSGVKVVNAIAAGRPVITQDTAAMRELAGPGTVVESVKDLPAALEQWAPQAARAAAVDQCMALAPALQLSAVAERYRAILQTVADRTAVPA